MKSSTLKLVVLLLSVVAIWLIVKWVQNPQRKQEDTKTATTSQRPVPVETAPIKIGPIEQLRTFSGSLEAQAEFVAAPKVSGRIEKIFLNIAEPVHRGQVIGELDNDEYIQAVNQAQAELAVVKAQLAEGRSDLEVANRDFARIKTLRTRGVASESQLDTARANQLAKKVELEVAQAQVARAESALETARIRLGYTRIIADWSGGDDQRVVAERYVDEGETVSANTPLLRIVDLDPIIGVVFVTERDYARLRPGQSVMLSTDAFPDREFPGSIARIAPVFKQATRQARVELNIPNPQQRLKPGMFIRATVVLARLSEANIVPEEALTQRDNQYGVFLVNPDGRSVSWKPVDVGIHENGRVQIEAPGLFGQVVILGQQLLKDGSLISIPADSGLSAAKENNTDAR
ncbi:MAG: efflux RND transporter periplasmic adaptor subunit [Deltaproteobacteria bacterium]|nr:efflux RND transporter periplasmic adaptor subunit [Deltaproteobacteria bacterium]